ncbi:MAG: bacillithiol biosynthesis cysteine-adding enzyme BshC, partial [Flavobacteriales bacterium]
PQKLALIEQENTYTITTGHQLCLFTGPLYFIYKIVTTINTAKAAKEKYNDNNFIPLFWMASEDHDFEEINHAYVFGNKITKEKGEKGATGRMNTELFQGTVEELREILNEENEMDRWLIQLFEKAFYKYSILKYAMRYIVHEIFGENEIIVVDGDDVQLKNAFLPVMRDEIFQNKCYKAIEKDRKKISENYRPQVTPREINLFYLKDGLRERIVQEEGYYKVLNTDISFSLNEIDKEIQEHPERFSPNVVLRPLYQEKVLPNLCYVGGGAELAYWLELKSLFDEFSCSFPALSLRNSALVLDRTTNKKKEKQKLSIGDLFKEKEQLIKERIKEFSDTELELNEEKKKLDILYSGIEEKASQLDPSLKNSVKGEKQKSLKGVENIEKKMIRAEKQKSDVTTSQINAVFEKVFPDNIFQERRDNIVEYFAKYGVEFLEELKREFDPFSKDLTIFIDSKNQ